MSGTIQSRKSDHLNLCASGDVAFRERTTLLEHVQLIHQGLPEIAWDEVDPSVELLGKTLRAPLYISAMTGGTGEAEQINRELALVAEKLGIAMGLGSQRAILRHRETLSTYQVRDVAPNALLFGNIGLAQARELPTEPLAELVELVGADALCVHTNPAMEVVQPGGDLDFRHGEETLARLVEELPVPVILKEVGSGLSSGVAAIAHRAGVRHLDVAGAGGTSWVAVETLRAKGESRALGEAFWDWGIPTAASLLQVRGRGMTVFASGGIRTGMDVARSLALGASVAGIATPVLKAQRSGGADGAQRYLEGCIRALCTAMFLSGCRRPSELGAAPRVLTGELAAWDDAAGELNR